METKEINVGDWFYYQFYKEPLKIAEVGMFMSSAWDINENFCGHINNNQDLTPIPLTEQILEKNGWKHNVNKDFIWHYVGENGEDSCFSLWYMRDKSWQFNYRGTPFVEVKIKCVHELQHIISALKLGLEFKHF